MSVHPLKGAPCRSHRSGPTGANRAEGACMLFIGSATTFSRMHRCGVWTYICKDASVQSVDIRPQRCAGTERGGTQQRCLCGVDPKGRVACLHIMEVEPREVRQDVLRTGAQVRRYLSLTLQRAVTRYEQKASSRKRWGLNPHRYLSQWCCVGGDSPALSPVAMQAAEDKARTELHDVQVRVR